MWRFVKKLPVFLASALLFFLTVIGSLLAIIGLCGTWLEISENGVTGEAILFLLAAVGGGALGTICFLRARRLRRTTCPVGTAPQKPIEGPGFELVYEDGHIRPYTPIDRSVPFVAERDPREIEAALESLGGVFSWDGYSEGPGQRLFAGDSLDGVEPSDGSLDNVEMKPLTDEMVAGAENAVRLKLPASYIAILRMQNGGRPYKNTYPDSAVPNFGLPVPDFCGIAPGHGSLYPIQEMPRYIWDAFEGYIDDEFYDQWRDTLDHVHPDWGDKPRLPEAVLFVAPEVHDGIALNYIKCGRQGEPSVVHVEMEEPLLAEVLKEVAPDFMTFLKMLYRESD